ncbi:MAG: hypothetical protein ACLPUT_00255 [Solirubrobacteraceae bacterium]
MPEELKPLDATLLAPPSAGVDPPTVTGVQTLPFQALTWTNFERLCLALARLDGDPEHAQRYGVAGQAQQGIDIYARTRDQTYRVYQCKRYESVTPTVIEAAVDRFLNGSWVERASSLVLCFSKPTDRTELAERIETDAARVSEHDVALEIWDADELSRRLKTEPLIVLDFFGRPWVEPFCTAPVPSHAEGRLDAHELSDLRARLRTFYARVFARHDAVSWAPPDATLTERFVMPAVLRQRELRTAQMRMRELDASHRATPAALRGDSRSLTPDTLLEERLPVLSWLSEVNRGLLVGSAGSGKSTLLHWLCLELLSDQPRLPGLSSGWSAFLPIWVPFGRWVSRIAAEAPDLSLLQLVEQYFGSYDEPDLARLAGQALSDERLMLLVDGLDEWTNAQAAAIACDRLQQVAVMRRTPALLCGRPEGLRALGSFDPEWSPAQLAVPDADQQRALLIGLGVGEMAAERLLRALARTPDLALMGTTPLLLALLSTVADEEQQQPPLPSSRRALLDRVLDELVEGQPVRRMLARAVPGPALPARADVDAALEALAFATQAEGPTFLPDARAREVAADALRSRGLSEADATALARTLLETAQSEMALLENDEPGLAFVHRSLQEHLAARALRACTHAARLQVFSEHIAQPAWRSVLVATVEFVDDEAEVDALIEALRRDGSAMARWAMSDMLAEVAVGPAHCSPSVKERLFADAIAEVESGLWPAVSRAVLDVLVERLGSPGIGERLLASARRWVPGRLGPYRTVYRDVAAWPEVAEVDAVLIRALRCDDLASARDAGLALVRTRIDRTDVADVLAEMLAQPVTLITRIATLEALSLGWPEHPALESSVQAARSGDDPTLQLVAIGHLVRAGAQREEDLDALLRLADGWTMVALQYGGVAAGLLRQGWPGSERVKRLALQTVRRVGERPIEPSDAEWLLLAGYPHDPEVVSWLIEQLQGEHPLLMLDAYRAYLLVGENFGDNPDVVAAVEQRIQTESTAFMPAIAGAALAVRTELARTRLLELLASEDSGALGWVIKALLEGWSDDREVADALVELARSPRAMWNTDSLIDLLPPGERDEWALALLADPANRRPGRAAAALADRSWEVKRQALEISLAREPISWRRDEELRDVLVSEYADLPAGEQFALARAGGPEVAMAVLVRGARLSGRLRGLLLEQLTPLSRALRRRLAQRVFEGAGDEAAGQLMATWRLERDPAAGATAASAFAAHRGDGQAELVVEALEALHAPRLEREGERQAGLAALIELDRLDRFAAERSRFDETRALDVGVASTLEPNWWLASRVAARWDELVGAVGEQAIDRLTEMHDVHGSWDAIAPFAATHPAVREACLAFVREHGTGGRPNLLRFLAAARPASDELLQALLAAVDGSVVDRSFSRDALLISADLLAEHFGSREEPPGALLERMAGWPSDGVCLALATGWPRSTQLPGALERLREVPRRVPIDIDVRLRLALGAVAEAAEALADWLAYTSQQAPLNPPVPSVLIRRLARDDAFARRLAEEVIDGRHPTRLATYARLLSASGRLQGQVRVAVLGACEDALEGTRVCVMAFDLLAGETRQLGLALLEALGGDL